MQELLTQYGADLTEGTLQDRFDRLWARSDQNRRDIFLKRYLDKPPSSGYHLLAELIAQGYFKLVITFNFDQLLESALRGAGLKENDDFLVVIRGECRSDEAVRQILAMKRPQVKVLKMHGGVKGGTTFLFNRAEMHEYPDEIKKLLKELTREDILVCGYAFRDDCVRNAFSHEGGSVYWVNPSEPPLDLKVMMGERRSSDWVVGEDGGKFDTFFESLHNELTRPPIPVLGTTPSTNPFKFLVSYAAEDEKHFRGREAETQKVLERLNATPPRGVIHLVGPAKGGKTSFVHAGVIAKLDAAQFPVYLRCHGAPPEIWLPQAIAKAGQLPVQKNESIKAAITRLCEKKKLEGKRQVVLVLDQFERVAQHYWQNGEEEQFVTCLTSLGECLSDDVNLICVEVDDGHGSFWKALHKANEDANTKHHDIELRELKAEKVAEIIEGLAQEAGIAFDADVVREITRRYKEYSKASPPFSLAHVQAVCNILARSPRRDVASYNQVIQENLDALDLALKIYEIMSFVEDIPDELRPSLFRTVTNQVPESQAVLNALAANAKRLFYGAATSH